MVNYLAIVRPAAAQMSQRSSLRYSLITSLSPPQNNIIITRSKHHVVLESSGFYAELDFGACTWPSEIWVAGEAVGACTCPSEICVTAGFEALVGAWT